MLFQALRTCPPPPSWYSATIPLAVLALIKAVKLGLCLSTTLDLSQGKAKKMSLMGNYHKDKLGQPI